VRYGLLGRLELTDEGHAIEVAGAKQRALLAILLLNANQVVSSDALIDALWEQQAPGSATKALHVHVFQLRKLLGHRLETRSPGYALRVGEGELDLYEFEALVGRARESTPAEAAAALREALALWRGPPLADFASYRFAQSEIARLGEIRLEAVEDRIEAELTLGGHRTLVGELEALVGEHPLRERLRGQLMTALYRSGRQAEALESYQHGRGVLVEELGIEPGRSLRELHQEILRQDPKLDLATTGATAPEAPRSASVGRGAEPVELAGNVLPAPRSGAVDARKVVTVVFADVTGSTALAEELDPESLRHLMSRYFEETKAAFERHGGTVEKFIGDAVVAVFGVPQAHEDDALRAVRAAAEIRETLTGLNREFDRSWGVTVAARTGINTGEVMAGHPGRGDAFVTGDAVNLAARLEQSAEPGEILIGDATHRLVRAAVVSEDAGRLSLKGKTEPVQVWRVLEVIPGVPGWTRRLDSRLVGREAESSLLREIYRRSADQNAAQLVTVMGAAGVGKSRLTAEFVSSLADGATTVRGRCLPYGEGITFWPIVAVLRDAAGIGEQDSQDAARSKLSQLLPTGADGALVGDRLAALLGLSAETPGIQETFWAVRKLFEHLGADNPLVVVFDDIQWGEPTFLDLLEYLADWIRTAPVVLVCLARPELLEVRPSWMIGKANATLTPLQPLSGPETDALIRNLIEHSEPTEHPLAGVAEISEGNPLFVEETLRMLVDDGLLLRVDGQWTVTGDLSRIAIPPTIHALLAARLDRLEAEERAVIERASVVGRVFWWGAVSELSPAEIKSRLSTHMQSLLRKELIRPHYAELGQDDAFQFAHLLIRDAAYNAIPKAVRAELHERLADWFEAKASERTPDYEELLGYHTEQAYRSLLELGPPNRRIESLGKRAAAALASGGRRAFGRGDMPAAANLLSRARTLLAEDEPDRRELLPQLAVALWEMGDLAGSEAVLAETTAAATRSGDAGLQAQALVLGLSMGMWTSPEGWTAEAAATAPRAITTFEEVGDQRGLAHAWSLLGLVHLSRAHFGPAEDAWREAAAHAHLAGDRRGELESLAWVPLTVWAGPTHVDEGLRRCQEVLESVDGDKKATSSCLMAQAVFHAGSGDFDRARELIAEAKGLLRELALTVWLAGPLAQFAGWVELLADDPVAAERELRWGYETLEEIGELGWLSTLVAILAEAVYTQDRHDEAEQLTRISEKSADSEDAYSQALWRSVRARVLARRGVTDEAERLARESLALADTTDFVHLRWHVYANAGDVLLEAGNTRDAGPILSEALAAAERKGSRVGMQRAHGLLERVRPT
jgi:class 3 adenylate cyclase/tetratricopeptide (TPR) repeat protein